MEELTIEQKAQKYDEAIKKLHEIITMDNRPVNPKEIGEYLFPELKDSEPKFHESEWLCENEPNNYARFIQILETVNVMGKEKYRISRDIHNDKDLVEFYFLEKYYHKFSINDAKDGDVLSYENEIFIVKKSVNINILYYCCYDMEHFIIDSFYSLTIDDIDNIRPATKEQRDLLFQKMKEAGYEWDTEKKELKKIENEIEIPFGAKDSELQEATYYIPKGFHAEIDNDNVIIKKGEKSAAWSEELKKVVDEEQIKKNLQDNSFRKMFEQKPTWSQEMQEEQVNEEFINTLGTMLNDGLSDRYLVSEERIKKSAELLFSIARRQLKNEMQEWSKEDQHWRQKAIDLMKHPDSITATPILVKNTIDWLKSLGPKKQWKPSEEQKSY